MALTSRIAGENKLHSLYLGFLKGLPIVIGYIPIALSYGVIAAQAGISLSHTAMMSVLVYAGAAQFMAVNMLLLGATGIEIILATFVLNLRHFIMGLAFVSRFPGLNQVRLSGMALGVTDETFAMVCLNSNKPDRDHQFVTIGLLLAAYGSWVSGSVAGWLLSLVIPPALGESMAIGLYAMFIGLLVPAIKTNWRIGVIALLAALISTLTYQVFGVGWSILLATTLASCAGIFLLKE